MKNWEPVEKLAVQPTSDKVSFLEEGISKNMCRISWNYQPVEPIFFLFEKKINTNLNALTFKKEDKKKYKKRMIKMEIEEDGRVVKEQIVNEWDDFIDEWPYYLIASLLNFY